MKVVIVGGGIIGLCTAYYLSEAGHRVTVIDEGDLTRGCSHGNMGYVSPSHFVPLASPGIVSQGLRWMLSASSPFYIKPRLNLDLLRWGFAFWKSAGAGISSRNVEPLNALLQLSRKEMERFRDRFPGCLELTERGCWMLYRNEKTGDHEKLLAEQAAALGLRTVICNAQQVQEKEPDTEVDVKGGVLYLDDCHLDPAKWMQELYRHLMKTGVTFWLRSRVTGFVTGGEKIGRVLMENGELPCDELVIASGSWMSETARKLGLRILMQPGKGYSIDYEGFGTRLRHPSILVDHRTATSPMGPRLRIGGTMELSGHNDVILPKRVSAIYEAFKLYYPSIQLPAPDPRAAWFGYRPLTPDGLPYIGRHAGFKNLSFAGGHAMLGVSAAAATGLLIRDILSGDRPPIDIRAFDPARF